MPHMTREEICKLAALARIELTEAEIEKFTTELSAIVSYVSAVQDLAASTTDTEPKVGDRYNVLRPDVVTELADEHTEVLLAEMPKTEGRYMVVKKILQTE
jgi:aspartyl-tRNA(Asn)/glutamyl-tRNA(Gln) amidotransferase subunit C